MGKIVKSPRGRYKQYIHYPTVAIPKQTQCNWKKDPSKTQSSCNKQLKLSLNNDIDNNFNSAASTSILDNSEEIDINYNLPAIDKDPAIIDVNEENNEIYSLEIDSDEEEEEAYLFNKYSSHNEIENEIESEEDDFFDVENVKPTKKENHS